MKRFLALLLVAVVVFLAARIVERLVVAAQVAGRGGGAGIENGDVNGSGARDISDAVYLLSYLFLGGPAPVPCAQAQGDLESRVAKLEAIVQGCFAFPDRNMNGMPDCAEPPFCGNGQCDPGESPASCPQDCFVDNDQDGFPQPQDCDDQDPQTRPGAPEVCDHRDNDCDGQADDGIDLTSDTQNCGDCGLVCPPGARCVAGACQAQDQDGDGFSPPQDCDDMDARVNPNAQEVCDNRDNDCDGATDDGAGTFCQPCVMGQFVNRCDDGNPCTLDSCNEMTQTCSNVPAPNGTACGAGRVCIDGVCVQQ
ncbi:MAG: hypothetical protein HY721_16380 [Planctomycetes bacterium]|nr:hypothetical protein [Planctomycetota bacterium]